MKLYVVGLGPGNTGEITPRGLAAIAASDVVAGYRLYIGLIADLVAEKEIISTAMRGERERCRAAVEAALNGKTVAVVSSGDAGVYGMAGLVLQLAEPFPALDIEVIPGVTAACSASAVLGAPLTHDFATISLSDLLTEWDVIETRLRLAAQANFVLCLYNPASKQRREYLARACSIILECRRPSTPCGIVRNIGRNGETSAIVPLEQLATLPMDMLSTIVVGNSETLVINGRLVTPRGYSL